MLQEWQKKRNKVTENSKNGNSVAQQQPHQKENQNATEQI